MNITDQELLKEIIKSPMTERERVLAEGLALKSLELSEVVDCLDMTSMPSEILHDMENVTGDILKIKYTLAELAPLCKYLEESWFDAGHEEEPTKETNPFEWIALKIARLENEDDEIYADSALTLAALSTDAHTKALDCIED